MSQDSESLERFIIDALQQHISLLGFRPLVHFELEGGCQFSEHSQQKAIDFDAINRLLQQTNIPAKLVEEFWPNQWEYVSELAGQSPLEEAEYLAKAMQLLPQCFAQQGVIKTLITPVIWNGAKQRMVSGSKQLFEGKSRQVHIPNAVQINVSVQDGQQNNLVAQQLFGECLQHCFLKTSLANSIIFLPEHDAFERILLKTKYGLQDELCSPVDISGGHQGSVALYRDIGKHNQLLGVEALVVDQYEQPMITQQNWQKTARVEHRIGAASVHYNPFWNVIYALANIIDALEAYFYESKKADYPTKWQAQQLPAKLSDDNGQDALALFEKDNWLSQRINQSIAFLSAKESNAGDNEAANLQLGEQLKNKIIAKYRHVPVYHSR